MIFVGIDVAKDKHDCFYADVRRELKVLLRYIVS